MKIAICQFNPTPGAMHANALALLDFAQQAAQKKADLLVAPELAICGYSPQDILFHPEFIEQVTKALEFLAHQAPVPMLLGAPRPLSEKETGQPFFNSIALVKGGQYRFVCDKQLLPNYGVFEERRYFEKSKDQKPAIIELLGFKLGLSICEDAWNDAEFWPHRRYDIDPIEQLAKAGADVLVNLSASPFALGKASVRESMFAHHVQKWGIPLVMAGQVGGNDQLLFDGGSLAIDRDAQVVARMPAFVQGLLFADVKGGQLTAAEQSLTAIEAELVALERGLCSGIRDYVQKSNAKGVLLGLSGGIDSAVVATLAARALGPKNVLGVRLPSQFTSDHALDDAESLAKNLGIQLLTLPIEAATECLRTTLLAEIDLANLTDQNLQARVRGILLMALSNQTGRLLLATGNKSELAVGYCTLYGDMCGALAPLGDVFKTRVWQLARHLNKSRHDIPENSITKPPSAELKPNQTDQDALPAYDVLDAVLEGYLDRCLSVKAIEQETGIDQDTILLVLGLVHKSEYKRKQAPPTLMTSNRAFSVGRRWPLAHGFQL